MVDLIAIHTIQARRDGVAVSYAPDTRFEMLDAEAEALVRLKAARYADPQNVSHGVPFHAPIQVSAPDTPEITQTPSETPEVASADASDDAPAPKRTRKSKTAPSE